MLPLWKRKRARAWPAASVKISMRTSVPSLAEAEGGAEREAPAPCVDAAIVVGSDHPKRDGERVLHAAHDPGSAAAYRLRTDRGNGGDAAVREEAQGEPDADVAAGVTLLGLGRVDRAPGGGDEAGRRHRRGGRGEQQRKG